MNLRLLHHSGGYIYAHTLISVHAYAYIPWEKHWNAPYQSRKFAHGKWPEAFVTRTKNHMHTNQASGAGLHVCLLEARLTTGAGVTRERKCTYLWLALQWTQLSVGCVRRPLDSLKQAENSKLVELKEHHNYLRSLNLLRTNGRQRERK